MSLRSASHRGEDVGSAHSWRSAQGNAAISIDASARPPRRARRIVLAATAVAVLDCSSRLQFGPMRCPCASLISPGPPAAHCQPSCSMNSRGPASDNPGGNYGHKVSVQRSWSFRSSRRETVERREASITIAWCWIPLACAYDPVVVPLDDAECSRTCPQQLALSCLSPRAILDVFPRSSHEVIEAITALGKQW